MHRCKQAVSRCLPTVRTGTTATGGVQVRARVRLQDVADRAGVSVKTVSNVVNGYVHVAPETRARVQAVLDETGYRPNLSARQLRTGRTGRDRAGAARSWTTRTSPSSRGSSCRPPRTGGGRCWSTRPTGCADREQAVSAGFRHHLIDGLILSPVALDEHDLAGRSPGDTPAGAARREAVRRPGGPRRDRQRGGGPHRHRPPGRAGQGPRRRHRRPAEQQPGVRRRAPAPARVGGGLAVGGTAGRSRAGRRGARLSARLRGGGDGEPARPRSPHGRSLLLQRHAGPRRAAGCWPTRERASPRTSR